jgi:molybdopterin/thiamine biosynthesis adenylyltransferase
MLTAAELKRYDRQISLPEIGKSGQERLSQARVLICGAGGLGSPVALYLAAAGIGVLKIVDCDSVSLDNLNRQILHGDADIGKHKVASARETLKRLNPFVTVETCTERISAENALNMASDADVIVDALDNLETRYIMNKAAVDLGTPLVHGAVTGFEGRILTVVPGKSACLRCMHRGDAPAAETFSVIGVTPAVMGSIQATEVIKLVLNIGEVLMNRLIIYDGLNLTWNEFKLKKNPECTHCGHLSEEGLKYGHQA